MKLKAGIIGGGKIAKVHARLFVELGISIVAVMSSSKKSSIEFSLKIEELFGLSPIPFHEIDDFLNLNMDLISICSPPKFHYNQILNSFNYSIPVFCEKPLLDISSLNNDKLKRQLENIKTHKNRFLFLNTSNTVFIDSLLNSYEFKLNFDKIKFEFYTTGSHNYKAIGLDLLPHGFSILVHVLKEQAIKNFNFKISKNKFECNFLYGSSIIEFDFRENMNGPKHMLFNFSGDEFVRKQNGYGESYQVSLIHTNTGQIINCEDPFRKFIKDFSKKLINKSTEDDFSNAEIITKLSAYSMDIINKG